MSDRNPATRTTRLDSASSKSSKSRSKSSDRRSSSKHHSPSKSSNKRRSTSNASKTSKKSKSRSRSPAKRASKGGKVVTKKELSEKKSSKSPSSSSRKSKSPAKRTLRSASTTSQNNSAASVPNKKGPLVSTLDRLKQEMDELQRTDVTKRHHVDEIDLTDLARLRKRTPPSSTPARGGVGASSKITITRRSLSACRDLSKSFCQKVTSCAAKTCSVLTFGKCACFGGSSARGPSTRSKSASSCKLLSALCPAKWVKCGYLRCNRYDALKFVLATAALVLFLAVLNHFQLIGMGPVEMFSVTKTRVVACVNTTVASIGGCCVFCTEKMKSAVLAVAGKISDTWSSMTGGGSGGGGAPKPN